MLNKLLCKLGRHWWGYQSKKTGIYLHTFADGTLPREKDYYTDMKKCWNCGKKSPVL